MGGVRRGADGVNATSEPPLGGEPSRRRHCWCRAIYHEGHEDTKCSKVYPDYRESCAGNPLVRNALHCMAVPCGTRALVGGEPSRRPNGGRPSPSPEAAPPQGFPLKQRQSDHLRSFSSSRTSLNVMRANRVKPSATTRIHLATANPKKGPSSCPSCPSWCNRPSANPKKALLRAFAPFVVQSPFRKPQKSPSSCLRVLRGAIALPPRARLCTSEHTGAIRWPIPPP